MKTPLEFSIFFTLPLEIPDKTKLQPWKFHKFLLATSLGNSKTKNQNPWLEIPHYFFLVTLGNSTLFLINPWKFYMLFLWQFDWYSWKFHILNPSCLVFSRMGQSHYRASTKTFVTLSRFWPLRGGGMGLSKSVKKENSWQKYFFLIFLNELPKICEKWYQLM